VLAATIGLRDNAVGNVEINIGEGITGRAAKQGRMVAVEDVSVDKRNVYIPMTGEEAFRSILSVPLQFHDDNIGVINVQTIQPRAFDKSDRQLLKTIAHQVSGLIRSARLFETVLDANKELEQAHERLIESEKMAALGRLSATLSHELRNPLAGLKGASQLLNRKTSDQDERKQYVKLIIEEVERLGKIVDDLIHFAKPKVLNIRMFDANKVIEDLLLLHSEDLAYKKIMVRKRLSKLPVIRADLDKFKQIVVNIMINAMDAMPDGGELLIISSVTIDEKAEREVVTFQFKDTGNGIAEDAIDHVLEPFFTTKPNGVGLGLAVSKSIIEQHGGEISIESGTKDGKPSGTLIAFEIPTNNKKNNDKPM
jgi:signal transduction histidine kinase